MDVVRIAIRLELADGTFVEHRGSPRAGWSFDCERDFIEVGEDPNGCILREPVPGSSRTSFRGTLLNVTSTSGKT